MGRLKEVLFKFLYDTFFDGHFYVNKIDDDFIISKPMRCGNFIDADSQLYIRTVQPFRIFIISLMSQCQPERYPRALGVLEAIAGRSHSNIQPQVTRLDTI